MPLEAVTFRATVGSAIRKLATNSHRVLDEDRSTLLSLVGQGPQGICVCWRRAISVRVSTRTEHRCFDVMHGGEFRQGRALIFESQPLVSREDTSCNEMQIRTEVAQSVLVSTPPTCATQTLTACDPQLLSRSRYVSRCSKIGQKDMYLPDKKQKKTENYKQKRRSHWHQIPARCHSSVVLK